MEEKDKIIHVPVDDIIPNRFQPRLAFDEKELNELANSIVKFGVIQPIVLRKIGDKYEIIAGERRYKASVLAGLKKVPAIVNNTDDNTSAEIALLENIQRKNLTVIEEAKSYKKLLDRGFTQETIATRLGVSQSTIANKLRLLKLPKKVQDSLLYNRISERHARCLLSLEDEDLQINLLEKIVSEKLTVKQTEEEVSIILNKNTVDNDIPDDIKKFLNPSENTVQKHPNVVVEEPKFESIKDEKENIPVIETITDDSLSEEDRLINERLERLLQPESIKKDETEIQEFLDIKVPEVVEINPDGNTKQKNQEQELKEYIDNSSVINPFQGINYEPVNTEIIEQLEISNNIDDIKIEKDITLEKSEEVEELLEEDNNTLIYDNGEVNLPKVINKVRDFVSDLGDIRNYVNTTELDLDGKYQIIIEIDKNTQ